LSVPFAIKESVGLAATNLPATVVVPLPYGQFTNLAALAVRTPAGAIVPAQFSVLNRWVGRDNSVRHVVAQFQASVGAYSGPGTGTNLYYLKDDGPSAFSTPLAVSTNATHVTVVTGPLKFTVDKRNFNLLDEVWLDADANGVFAAAERMLANATNQGAILVDRFGAVQRDAWRTNVVVEVEESGPLRAVIRASSPTRFATTNDHVHGFAVRIYAYANQPYVKIDYQLQNGAINTDIAWPLYFDSLNLEFALAVSNLPAVAVGLGTNGVWQAPATNAARLAQTFHSTGHVYGASASPAQTFGASDGWLSIHKDSKGVAVFVRNFWQTWPNGISYTNDGTLRVELFPNWSAQYFATNNSGQKFFTPTGLYWLEDMQATFKEVVLHFHSAPLSTSDLRRIAAHLETPPVPVVPLDWYRATRATFDFDGIVPPGTPADPDTSRLPGFIAHDWNTDHNYRFGWDSYYVDEPIRKYGTATTGGWPDTPGSRFFAVGNPAYFHDAERKALAELNMRPHWLPGYNHVRDYDRMRLTTAPYAGQSWRRFDGHGSPWIVADYLPGTALDACPRDDQHGWYQHMNDWYHFTANLWARDWYEFIDQFRHTSLLRTHPYDDTSGRGRGHALAHALAAYRATGNPVILDHFATEVRALRATQFHHGGRYDADKDGAPAGASWQAGYVGRAVVDYMNEIQGARPREWAEAFAFVAGLVDWNKNHANFSYYMNPYTTNDMPSSSTGLIMVDLQSWYALATGDSNAMRQTMLFVTNGIFGGERPAGNFDAWIGQYESRQWIALTNAVAAGRPFTNPPPVATFSATAQTGQVTFSWRGMPNARRYHLFWSDKEISLPHTLNTNLLNWWAADTTLTNVSTSGGENLSLSVPSSLPAGTPVSACIFYVDAASNMSVKTEIAQPPVAAFAGGPLRGAAPLTVHFTNQTLRQITGARWAFGDGTFSNATHATRTYASAGDYSVSLTVSNAAGSNTLVRSAYVHVVAPGMPIADFSWSTNRGPAPLSVQFTNLSVGTILSNRWDFGDGATSALSSPAHVFATAGIFTVALVAYTASGSDTCRIVNAIEALPPPPVADFSAFPRSGGYPLSVQFTNLTTGAATNWHWTFGDGQTSAARDPQHAYALTGTYSVALVATGAGGSHTNAKTDYIVVLPETGDDYRISANTDDAQEYASAVTLGEGFIYLGYSADMLSGYRFQNVQLPRSSLVVRAYIQFASTSGRADPALAVVHAQKSTAPATFATNANDLSSRPLTHAAVSWNMPEFQYNAQTDNERTPDLSALVREVVAQPGWTPGAPIAFIFATTGAYGEQGMRHVWTRESALAQNAPERVARLHLEYATNVNFAAFKLTAVPLANSVMLRWTDPARCGLPGWHALLRADSSNYPATPTSGALVAATTNLFFHETNLPSGHPRHYTLWLSPDATNWLAPSPP
jgi:PKD repeat protein